jgi:hypothetical protein
MQKAPMRIGMTKASTLSLLVTIGDKRMAIGAIMNPKIRNASKA